MTLEEIKQGKVAPDFLNMLSIFTEYSYTEFFYEDKGIDNEENRWEEKYY